MKKYGYVRVSTQEQKEDRQLLAMEGEELDRIFVDKQSGKDFDRPAYRELKSVLREGDVLCIKSIDRLGRNYREIQDEWRILVHELKVDIYVLDMPLLDTRTGKDLLGTFVSDLVLQILSFVSENERNNIRSRQAEGIRAARKRGVKFGRPEIAVPQSFYTETERWKKGLVSYREAASRCGMSGSTFLKKVKEMEEKERTEDKESE